MSEGKSALIVATVPQFFTHMRMVTRSLENLGYTVSIATNLDVHCHIDLSGYYEHHNICFQRFPFSPKNATAYRQLKDLLRKQPYDIVFCNTPVGGVLGRLSAKNAGNDSQRVIYMAHGFHFFEGGPWSNWVIYYPVEWLCSWLTDDLLTITEEDYSLAETHLHARRTWYVPGVGVNLDAYSFDYDKGAIRDELGIASSDTMVLSVGELNKNKNHEIVVRALPILHDDVHYVVAGEGDKREELLRLAYELGVDNRLHLLGYRKDVPELLAAADVFVLPSKREGLNVSLIEAMASGLPCVCRDARGNVDLIDDGAGGLLVDVETPDAWASSIEEALKLNSEAVRKHNKERAQVFCCENVCSTLTTILAQTER